MLSPAQIIETMLPQLIEKHNSNSIYPRIPFNHSDFSNSYDIGLISYTGEKPLINLKYFLKLTEQEQLNALAFISFCIEEYSDYIALQNNLKDSQDIRVLQFAYHFYTLNKIKNCSFDSISNVFYSLKDGISIGNSLLETFDIFKKIDVENLVEVVYN